MTIEVGKFENDTFCQGILIYVKNGGEKCSFATYNSTVFNIF